MLAMWRKASEIGTFGHYLMFRTDDDVRESNMIQDIKHFRVEIAQGAGGRFYLVLNEGKANNNAVPVDTLDPQCRFFGPILNAEYEMARDLIMGLTGGLGVLINDDNDNNSLECGRD